MSRDVWISLLCQPQNDIKIDVETLTNKTNEMQSILETMLKHAHTHTHTLDFQCEFATASQFL